MLKVFEYVLSSPILFWGCNFLILKCAEWVIQKLKYMGYIRAVVRT